MRNWPDGKMCWTVPILLTRNALSKDRPRHRRWPRLSGSIGRQRRTQLKRRRQSPFVNVHLVDICMSHTLLCTDAEDRALLESNLSAAIGDDVALGRIIITWLCPESPLPARYIVLNAKNSFARLRRSLAVRQNSVRTPQLLTNFRHELSQTT